MVRSFRRGVRADYCTKMAVREGYGFGGGRVREVYGRGIRVKVRTYNCVRYNILQILRSILGGLWNFTCGGNQFIGRCLSKDELG